MRICFKAAGSAGSSTAPAGQLFALNTNAITSAVCCRDRRPGLFDFVSGLLDEKTE